MYDLVMYVLVGTFWTFPRKTPPAWGVGGMRRASVCEVDSMVHFRRNLPLRNARCTRILNFVETRRTARTPRRASVCERSRNEARESRRGSCLMTGEGEPTGGTNRPGDQTAAIFSSAPIAVLPMGRLRRNGASRIRNRGWQSDGWPGPSPPRPSGNGRARGSSSRRTGARTGCTAP